MNDAIAAALDRAHEALDAGDDSAAFVELHTLLDWPGSAGLVDDPGGFARALGLLAQCTDFGPEVADEARAAAEAPDQVGRLYRLGHRLVDSDLPGLAATVLLRALRVAPDEEATLTELVAALEATDLHDEAVRVLEAAGGLAERFMPRYLLAFNRAMGGDLAGAAMLSPGLLADAADDTERFLARRIAGLSARGAALSPGDDPRAWEMVLSASILLWTGPDAGRFDTAHDAPAELRRALDQVAALLSHRRVPVPRVFVFPHHGPSHGLGLAAAKRLGVEALTWSQDVADLPGLLVAWEVSALGQPTSEQLVHHRPGQILWGHGTRWRRDHRVAADITTHLFKDPAVSWSELAKTDPAALCDAILAASPDEDPLIGIAPTLALLERLAALEAERPELGSALAHVDGERERRWRASPLTRAHAA